MRIGIIGVTLGAILATGSAAASDTFDPRSLFTSIRPWTNAKSSIILSRVRPPTGRGLA